MTLISTIFNIYLVATFPRSAGTFWMGVMGVMGGVIAVVASCTICYIIFLFGSLLQYDNQHGCVECTRLRESCVGHGNGFKFRCLARMLVVRYRE